MEMILRKDLKPEDRIILPGGIFVEVLSVEEDAVLVEVYGGDRDDDNLRELCVDELPDSFQTWL